MAAGQFTPLLTYPTILAFDSTFLGSGLALSNSNHTVTCTADSTWSCTRSTTSKSVGKWYWEISLTSGINGNAGFGICISTQGKDPANFPASDTNAWMWFGGGSWWYNNVNTATYSSWTNGDVLNFALDMGAGKIWIGKNGTWQNSGNPDAGTGNVTSTSISGSTIFICAEPGFDGNGVVVLNCGSSTFANSPANINTFIKGFY